ncbi:MAG TPA: D-alanyl-D-alanine carboxypeptidase family protein [Candidatus Synoicihabitans sp.]|nr:D-alanyl-D-alanine carboxypeptidase family protein [Candidatus Synoicihabitans sp.]
MVSLRLPGLLLFVLLHAAASAAPASYKGAIVVDADSGDVLFEDNAGYVGPPASVTKLMSFLIVKDQIKAGRITRETPVTTTAADARIGGTQVWLKEKEVFTVEELLMAMMIKSANDAAHALSHTAAESREAFVAAMNERARELGMNDTTWRTPHGLPPSSRKLIESDVTSPRDLAVLSRTLLRETDVLRYTSIALAYFGEGKRAQPVMMDNHNNLVGKVRGVDGLKTGYTASAGFCLAATAERDGRRLIGVIMGSPSTKDRDMKMAQLLEASFAKLLDVAPPPAPSGGPPSISRVPLDADDLQIEPANDAETEEEPPMVRFNLPR